MHQEELGEEEYQNAIQELPELSNKSFENMTKEQFEELLKKYDTTEDYRALERLKKGVKFK